MKHFLGLALLVAASFLATLADLAWADPPKEPYSPPIGQRGVQGVWNGIEYVYDGDWAPEWLYKKNKDRQVDNPNAFEKPGDYRDQSRPGYRARPTPQSVAYYRYVMEKIGRGEDINVSESIIIRRMIQNRTWPEAPTVSKMDRGALDWADKQSDSEDSSIFTDPEGWTRKKNADLIYENMTSRGCTEEDTPASEGIEKFREYWQTKTPEEKKNLPLGRWMKNYLVRKGFDMRSDEERADDDAYAAKQEEKRQKAEAAKTEAERQAEDKVQQEAQRQKDWFKDKWEEEDRRAAEKEAIERLEQKIEESKRDGEPTAEEDTPEDTVTPDTEDEPEAPPAEPDTPENEVEPENEIDGEKVTPDKQPVPSAPLNRDRERKPEVVPESEDAQGDDVEPEAYPEKQPELAESSDARDGSRTTTKGYVQGSDGSRVTLTETRNPDGSVTTTTTETDPDGNVISQTSYGESGEGRTSTPGGGLRGAEAKSDAEVDIEMATDGYKAADSYSANWTDTQDQRGTDGSMTMAQNAQMQESANIGNQDLWNARATRDGGGRDAQFTADAARQKSSKADRENSWGKAIGDAVESGITEGGKAFGQALGQGASDRAIGEIFGSGKDASDSAGVAGGAAPAQVASTAPSDSRSKKPAPKKKPSSGGSSSSSDASATSAGAGTSDADLPPADPTDPIGVSSSTKNTDGTITITYGCTYTWTGKPPGPSRCPICDRETISTTPNPASSSEDSDIPDYEPPTRPVEPPITAPADGPLIYEGWSS
jgi:hypothetical protein